MFLSEVIVNSRNPLGQQDLGSAYQLHRTLSGGFSAEARPRLLFRQEVNVSRVLMLSEVEPALDQGLASGRLLSVRSKPFAPRLRKDQSFRFRLLANPTQRKEGSRRALLEAAEQINWLSRKAENHGFQLLSFHITRSENQVTARPGAPAMTHMAVDFQGSLVVRDPDLFTNSLLRGIGSAKAFGFGMLCVAR